MPPIDNITRIATAMESVEQSMQSISLTLIRIENRLPGDPADESVESAVESVESAVKEKTDKKKTK